MTLDTTYSECPHGSPKCKQCKNKRVVEWVSVYDKAPPSGKLLLCYDGTGFFLSRELDDATHWVIIDDLLPHA